MANTPQIHPTALISPEADLAADVVVGPYVVVEGSVRLGPGCVVRPHVHLIGPLTVGANNTIHTGAVLGDRPQHLKFHEAPSGVVLGDGNTIREHVTIHSGTRPGQPTRLGNDNFLMANSHVAHDCEVGSRCILANGALLAGHCVLQDGVFISGNSAVHQFCRVGRLALLGGVSATTRDQPPFIMQQGINVVVGYNVVGMRRAGISNPEIEAVRKAFHLLYRQGNLISTALEQVERTLGHFACVMELTTFIRQSTRGVNGAVEKRRHQAA